MDQKAARLAQHPQCLSQCEGGEIKVTCSQPDQAPRCGCSAEGRPIGHCEATNANGPMPVFIAYDEEEIPCRDNRDAATCAATLNPSELNGHRPACGLNPNAGGPAWVCGAWVPADR